MEKKNITEILAGYTAGKTTVEETNAALKEAGARFHLDPEKNVIKPEEVGKYGLLDTGTGTLDKVELAEDGRHLVYGCGEMRALCFVGGKVYEVQDTELAEKE